MSGDQRGKVGQVNPLSLPGPGVQEETLILEHTVQHTSSCPRVRAGLQPPRLPTAGRTLGGPDWPHPLAPHFKMAKHGEFYFKTNTTLRREACTLPSIKFAPVHHGECVWMSISSRP